MNKEEKEAKAVRFKGAITALAATFDREPTDPLLMGYWLGLQDISEDDLNRAVARAIRECDFMPKPAELRRLAGEVGAGSRAVAAWAVIAGQVGSIGSYQSVNFDDPIVNATIRSMGGWPKLCGQSSEQFGVWVRKEFLDTYAALCETGVTEEAAKYLIGRTEQDNAGTMFAEFNHEIRQVHLGLPGHSRQMLNAAPKQERHSEQAQAQVLKLVASVGKKI